MLSELDIFAYYLCRVLHGSTWHRRTWQAGPSGNGGLEGYDCPMTFSVHFITISTLEKANFQPLWCDSLFSWSCFEHSSTKMDSPNIEPLYWMVYPSIICMCSTSKFHLKMSQCSVRGVAIPIAILYAKDCKMKQSNIDALIKWKYNIQSFEQKMTLHLGILSLFPRSFTKQKNCHYRRVVIISDVFISRDYCNWEKLSFTWQCNSRTQEQPQNEHLSPPIPRHMESSLPIWSVLQVQHQLCHRQGISRCEAFLT